MDESENAFRVMELATSERQPIETAPKDGQWIWVLSRPSTWETPWGDPPEIVPPAWTKAKWWPKGTSWTDEHGNMDGNVDRITMTGVWITDDDGWLQPNEVTHWLPLSARSAAEKP